MDEGGWLGWVLQIHRSVCELSPGRSGRTSVACVNQVPLFLA